MQSRLPSSGKAFPTLHEDHPIVGLERIRPGGCNALVSLKDIQIKPMIPSRHIAFTLISATTFLCAPLNSSAQRHAPASDGVSAAQLNAKDKEAIEHLLAKELQNTSTKAAKVSGQKKFKMSALLSQDESLLQIDLGKEAIPDENGPDYEEQCSIFIETVRPLLIGLVSVENYECTFGGKDIHFYHPETVTPGNKPTPRVREDPLPLVVLSAGHGLYLDHPAGKPAAWLPQRPLPSNGITEDFITPGYVSEISSALNSRGSQISIAKTRSESNEVHTPTGDPWWKVAARYHLQNLLPTHGEDIWNTLPNDHSKLMEYKEDIRARPFYANYLGADYLVNIHTNAGINTTSRGTTGWYHNGEYADSSRILTSNILCSMREIIRANRLYADWTIDTVPRGVANKGENRLARLASTIIEIAFHTNPDDAIALQDSTFRNLASKGIAKGLDLNKDGKHCATFKIESIPATSGPQGSQVPYTASYSGNPTFPITMHFEPVKCAPDWTCQSGTRETLSTSSPLTFQFSCGRGKTSSTFVFKRWLVDADGVKTEPTEVSHTCVRAPFKSDLDPTYRMAEPLPHQQLPTYQ